MTKDEHKQLIADVIERAKQADLCDVFVIGQKPKGGLHIDWSGTTTASLVLYLSMALQEALEATRKEMP